MLSYNPRTRELRVLRRKLAGPNGVAVSRDGSFLFFIESVTNTIQRFWLKGPKANTAELVAQVKDQPDNIKRNGRGEFWVATNVNASLPTRIPVGLRFSEEGVLLQNVTLELQEQCLVRLTSSRAGSPKPKVPWNCQPLTTVVGSFPRFNRRLVGRTNLLQLQRVD